MSFVFRGARSDLEGGLPGLVTDRRYVSGHRFHGTGRHVNTNSMGFLISVGLLCMILNSEKMSINLMIWVGISLFLLASSLRMYSICHQFQAQAQAAAAAATAGGFLSHTELRLHYDALRVIDEVNFPGVPGLSDTDINRLPVRMYKRSSLIPAPGQSLLIGEGEELLSKEVKVDIVDATPNAETMQDKNLQREQKIVGELTCSVCLEEVVDDEIVRTLPCVHQFHAACIDLWLRQQATCPVCKFRLGESDTSMASSVATTTAFIV